MIPREDVNEQSGRGTAMNLHSDLGWIGCGRICGQFTGIFASQRAIRRIELPAAERRMRLRPRMFQRTHFLFGIDARQLVQSATSTIFG
jgi:hypothetical protein